MRSVVDGPFIESKEILAGFAIFDASSLDEALGRATRFATLPAFPLTWKPPRAHRDALRRRRHALLAVSTSFITQCQVIS
jgi:hypothetical protein